MKQKLRMFAICRTVTSLQRPDNLNPRTIWYPALDELNRMKSTYFTIHPGKNLPPQNGCQLKSVFFFKKRRFHILHFPKLTGLFIKPTGCHYTKYRFSPDIVVNEDCNFVPKSKKKNRVKREIIWTKRWSSWPLHTRDREPATTTLQALSLVEMVELVQVRFTLHLRDQWSMWM